MKNSRDQAKAKVEFRIHVFTFIAVIVLLVVINLLTSPEYLWFVWPLLGWGIALAIHAYTVHFTSDGPGLKERMIEKEMEKSH